ncbi:thiamine pyrophosphate-binding protein [Halobaculum sp. EA56]|uniref:thiamine pyrophosphate-binding protein n=1 Tax=Halobaculum sp. EA56 TaxID=3421648 RepID=UPI003EBC4D97
MERTAADRFVDALAEYGVTRVFGNPGTTELPVMRALGDSDLEYVLGLHEDVAVGAAAGYAQTRRYHAHRDPSVLPLGVVNLHVAPGVAHGLGNLYDASVTGAPLLVTAGNHSTDFRHEEPILSGDLAAMVDQYCKWSGEALDASAVPTLVRRAVRTALTPPTGPVFLALPLDVMTDPADAGAERLGPIPTAGRGDPAALERAADLLAAAEEPVLVVGDGVARSGRDAVDAAVDLAEAAGARVHGEILACETNFPVDHDQWVSFVPTDPDAAAALQAVDALAFVGCSTHTTLTRREEGRDLVPEDASLVHLGADARELGKNTPADAAVVGDPGALLAELATLVGDRVDDAERERRLERVAATRERVRERFGGRDGGDPGDPRPSKGDLIEAMARAASDALVVDESVTAKYELLTRWPLEPEGFVSNKGGGLGYGLPAAVGAAMAEAERERETDGADGGRDVLGFVGDGSYLYYPQTLYTAARYGVDLTVVVPDNRNYRILKDNMLGLFGGDEDDYEFVGMDFEPPVDIPANAESHGARGELVESGIEEAVREAMDRDGPDVLDVPVHD